MKQYLLPENGTFYKANMHMHTNISDGKMTPEDTKRVFKEKGYSIVAFTDHEVLTPHNDLADEDFLPITSYEVNRGDRWPEAFSYTHCYHFNLYAKNKNADVSSVFGEKYFWGAIQQGKEFISEECAKISYSRHYSVEGMNDLIRRANEDGFLVCYNHPVWSGQRYPDYAGLKGLWGIEVFNSGCNRGGYLENSQPFDDLLHMNESPFPIAADDAHGEPGCGHGWIQVKADALEYDTVMGALERGDFYASTGPEIHELYIENGVVHIETSEVREIFLRTERRFTCWARENGSTPLTGADFNISSYIEGSKNEPAMRYRPWFRFEVVDKNGKIAYTRAYFVDELSEA